MEIRTVRALRGPHIWGRCTALEAVVALEGELSRPVAEQPGLETRLREWLPSLDLSAAPVEGSSRVFGPPAPVDSLAHVLGRVVLTLQTMAGSPVAFGRTASLREPGTFKVVAEYREEQVGRDALEAARQLLTAAVSGATFDVAAAVEKLRKLDQNIRLGPSTGSIVQAAKDRGIPIRRLNEGSLVQFGWGSRQRRILAAETDRTSAIGESIAQDKELTKTLLRSVGVPVPEGQPVESAEEAWTVACEIGLPVVVKPQYGNQGRGVAVNLSTREQVLAAYAAAREEGSSILVEKFAPGDDYRLLVVGSRVVAAAVRHPPRVTGDGVRSIEQLVAEANLDPRRGEDHATSLSKLRLDAIGLAVLAEQGYTPASVPPLGTLVVLRRNANLSTGGTATDVTAQVHPEVAARMVEAARVVGLDIAGVDVVCRDIGRPLEEQNGVIVEVNAAPGLRMHLQPSEGRPQPVGEAIVATLYADGDEGRIPLVAVTGNNGKTTTTRLMAHLLKTSGKRVGMTCTDGIYIDGRRIDTGDCSGPKSAKAVLLNPMVEAAVLETARGGILREGLGFDRCDVAIVTNIGEGDHLGMNGIDTVEQLAAVKGTLVENVSPAGSAVLNAADPLTAAMAERCTGKVIFFAREAAQPVLAAHLARGGRGVFAQDGALFLAEGSHRERLVELEDVPLTHNGRVGFQVENVLATVAAAWSLGLSPQVVRAALATFSGTSDQTPGRFTVRSYAGATLIMDYGHNPDALLALIEAFGSMPHSRRAAVFTAAGDRRDVDIIRQAEIIANAFDRAVVFEDACNRGREDGAVLALLREGFARGSRLKEVVEARGEQRAIEMCLRQVRPGDLVLIQVDQVESSLAFIERFITTETPAPTELNVPRPESTPEVRRPRSAVG
ncbi:cyanophycin synthetase [Archangium sp.]|uniref:cyanophycin synthetase n=1 Tax=Archangium sp. TaxID=1872627 RepID=UPI00389B3067